MARCTGKRAFSTKKKKKKYKEQSCSGIAFDDLQDVGNHTDGEAIDFKGVGLFEQHFRGYPKKRQSERTLRTPARHGPTQSAAKPKLPLKALSNQRSRAFRKDE